MQVYHTLAEIANRPESYDVVVVGAGGAGLAAALFAAIEGKKVLIVESTPSIRLESGDRLVVPNRPDFVYVFGSVNTESALLLSLIHISELSLIHI